MRFSKKELETIIKSLVESRDSAEFNKPVGVYECMIDNVINAFMHSATFDPANNLDAAVFNVVNRAFNQYKMQINNLARENDILRMKLAGVNNGVNVPDDSDQELSDTVQIGCGCGACVPPTNPKPVKIKPLGKPIKSPLQNLERVKSLEEILSDEMVILDALARAEHPETVVNINNAAFTPVNAALKARMVELDMINVLTNNESAEDPVQPEDTDKKSTDNSMRLAFNKIAKSINNATDIIDYEYEDVFKDCFNEFANFADAINAKIAALKDLHYSIDQETKVIKTFADCINGSKDVNALKESLAIICPTTEMEAANSAVYNSIANIFRSNDELAYVDRIVAKIKHGNLNLIEIDHDMDNHATAMALIGAYNTSISKLMEETSIITHAIDNDKLIDFGKVNIVTMKRIATAYNAYASRCEIADKMVEKTKEPVINAYKQTLIDICKQLDNMGKLNVKACTAAVPPEYKDCIEAIVSSVNNIIDANRDMNELIILENAILKDIASGITNKSITAANAISSLANGIEVNRFSKSNKNLLDAIVKALKDRNRATSFNTNDNNIKLINPDAVNDSNTAMPIAIKYIGVDKPFLAIFNNPMTNQLFTGIYVFKKDMKIHEYYSGIAIENTVVYAIPLDETFINKYSK